MIKIAVIGDPISHSKSPALHSYWLKKYAIKGEYKAEHVKPDQLENWFKTMVEKGFSGCNITIPHKEESMKYMDEIDPLAQKIGAINTVVIDKNGKKKGFNTDGFGFCENLLQHGAVLENKTILLLGAGGASRAIIVGLQECGVKKIVLLNRTLAKAEALVAELGGNIVAKGLDALQTVLPEVDILINATSVGMSEASSFDIGALPREAIVTDIVYNPLITPLLIQAKQQGNKIVDGLGMLLYQAVPGFEKWFGRTPEVTSELREKIMASL